MAAMQDHWRRSDLIYRNQLTLFIWSNDANADIEDVYIAMQYYAWISYRWKIRDAKGSWYPYLLPRTRLSAKSLITELSIEIRPL